MLPARPDQLISVADLPDACELCGATGFGFTIQPLLRVCKPCMSRPAIDVFRLLHDRHFDVGARMLRFPK